MLFGDLYNFFPNTMLLSETTKPTVYKYFGDQGPWIGKPSIGSRGKGIYLENSLEKLEQIVVQDFSSC